MAACPSCGRPAASARPRCLYCGAALPASPGGGAPPAAPAPPGAPGPEEPTPGEASSLLILDLGSAALDPLAEALGLPAYEAAQRLRRGGYQLHRIAPAAHARAEAERLGRAGLAVIEVPAAEARAAGKPLLATGGRRGERGLELRTPEGPRLVHGADLLIVVRGPIAREYQALAAPRKVWSASLEAGYRFHLHERSTWRPIELDPGSFAFEEEGLGTSSLLLGEWLASLAPEAPVDDAFRQAIPALAPAAQEEGGLAAARALLARSAPAGVKGPPAPVALDNLAQFRFYSGWRAAVERRRGRGGG